MSRPPTILHPTEPRILPILPRRAVYGPSPTRLPRPTGLGLALGIVLALLIAGVGVAIARAEDEDVARFEPTSRGGRVLERGEVLERAEVVSLAAEAFGPSVAGYVANIVLCESTNNPNADINPPYIGLMQVDPYLHYGHVSAVVGYPVGPADAAWLLRVPRINLLTAVRILREQGWGAWPVCSR